MKKGLLCVVWSLYSIPLLCTSSSSSFDIHNDAGHPPLDDISDRVQKLLQSMTIQQKIFQTFAGHGPRERFLPMLHESGFGGVKLSQILGFDYRSHSTLDRIRARNELQHKALNASNIPLFFYDEGDHGATPGGTIFPMPIGQGCSWNVSLVQQISQVLAKEASVVGVDTLFAPVVNMVTDPRFGRMQENFGEEPLLTSHMAVASVLGLQQSQVASLAKHFAAYGDASGGLNGGSSSATERMLHDIFLRPWKAMAAVGLKALMPAHNTVLHMPCHANEWLLNQTIRNSFRFQGIMLSDCNDIATLSDFRIASNISHAAALALKAGVDLDLQCNKDPDKWAYNHLQQALDSGIITEQDLDRTVSRVLRHKLEMGLFDKRQFTSETDFVNVLDNPEHRRLAREAAEQSIVLLLNRNESLPLRPSDIGSIALLGPTASREACQCPDAVSSLVGDYAFGGAHVVTLDEALNRSLPDVRVEWAKGCTAVGPTGSGINQTEIDQAVQLARQSDVTILVLGDLQGGCGEWKDRDDLDLQGSQLTLLKAVTPVSKKTIVILVHGRPQTFGKDNEALKNVNAMFAAWRPGEEFGHAMVNLLTGATNPSAKLSTSWPRYVGQVGSGSVPWLQEVKGKWVYNKRGSTDEDGRRYNYYDSSNTPDPTPLFYFGYGLSYTTFQYENMTIQDAQHHDDDDTMIWQVHVTVSNTGPRDGVEVIQVYAQDPIGVLPYVPFWKRLIGFTRCAIPAGARITCLVSVKKEDLACFDPSRKEKMGIYKGIYKVSVGGSSNADALVQETMVQVEYPSDGAAREEEIVASPF